MQGYGNSEKVLKIPSEQVENIIEPTREGYRFVGWNVGGENLIKDKISSNSWSTEANGCENNVSGVVDVIEDTREVIGISVSIESYIYYNPGVYIEPSHKYFYSIEAKTDCIGYYNTIDIYWPIAEPNLDGYGSAIRNINEWTKICGITSARWSNAFLGYSGKNKVRYDFNNEYVEGRCTFRKPILIDLTETYGEGNEPSEEWCDNNIIYGETRLINIPQDSYGKIVYFAVWEPKND